MRGLFWIFDSLDLVMPILRGFKHIIIRVFFMSPKSFTLEEVNNIVPNIAKIFDKITAARVKAELIKESLDSPPRGRPEEQEDPKKLAEKMQVIGEEIRKYVEEIKIIGCVIKDLDNYLVDFYSSLDGKPIFLCWKYGEQKIQYWHGIENGFMGRQPLSAILQEVR